MARARNIKPGIMENDVLAECDFAARLLFVYLWMLADRDGRLEDKPRKIRAQAFPYDDDIDVNALLDQLNDRGFIQRYVSNETQYIQIVKFTEHQTPHIKEKASTIQAPDKHQTSTRQAPDKHQTSTRQAPDKHDTSTRQAPDKTDTCTGVAPPDSLIVDTGFSDSLIPESPIQNRVSEDGKQKNRKTRITVETLPDDWKKAALDYWHSKQRFDISPDDQFFKFRNYHEAKGSMMINWAAAWRTWYANSCEFKTATVSTINPPPRQHKPLVKAGTEQ